MSDLLPPFKRLARGQLVLGTGKILVCDRHVDHVEQTGVDLIVLEGDDLDAMQVTLTLDGPCVLGPHGGAAARLRDHAVQLPETHDPPLEALIEFGTGGVTAKVVVDYVSDVVLSVFASYLRVTALVTQRYHVDDVVDTAYYCAAQVGPGLAESHVRRTIFVGGVDEHGESAVFAVPKFGKVATLIGCKGICFWQDPSHRVGNFVVPGPQSCVAVPKAASYFSVFDEPSREMKTAVIFELGL